MITVKALYKKLRTYSQTPGNEDVEILLQYDGDIALEFSHGTDETVLSPAGGVVRFLVLRPEQKSKKRLKLKGSI